MPTCKGCDTETTALHYGGDAQIAPPGLCDDCQQVEAKAAGIVRQQSIDTRAAARAKQLAKGN